MKTTEVIIWNHMDTLDKTRDSEILVSWEWKAPEQVTWIVSSTTADVIGNQEIMDPTMKAIAWAELPLPCLVFR